jgi:hypothetical protein
LAAWDKPSGGRLQLLLFMVGYNKTSGIKSKQVAAAKGDSTSTVRAKAM